MHSKIESGKMIKKLFIMFCVFASVGSESCKAFQIKKEHLNKRLIGHEIAEIIVKEHHECVRECFYLSLCKSTDYYKRENTCKLNDADSISAKTTEFEDKPGAVFSDITEWPSGMAGVCGQRPCSEKQKCFPDKDGYRCKEVCGSVPNIDNGIVALDKPGKMLYMDTATVTCHDGYGADKQSIQCQASGTWESVSCEKMCGSVPNIENGVVALDKPGKMLYMDTATVTCHDGYETDKPSIQCQASGTWESVSCEKRICGMVPTIENGVVALEKPGKMLYMDTATVTCHDGYGADKPSIQCQASGTWESVSCGKITDCKDMHRYFPSKPSGVYEILLWQSLNMLSVYCDMDTDGGGWTVFQSRFNGSIDFYRNSSEYENGFGNIESEFWLGLKYMQEMASQDQTELRMDLTAADDSTAYETFQNFYLDVGPEYTLHIDPGTGTAGDDFREGFSHHNGQHFTTYGVDRDPNHQLNCAVNEHGGWWYGNCGNANLNGEYVTPGTEHPDRYWAGMFYYQFKGKQSLKTTKMMFRRV